MSRVSEPNKARRETGGPGGPGNGAAASQAAAPDLETRIIAIRSLTTKQLRREWQRLYRVTPPTRLSPDLMRRGIAYALQERLLGGLSPGTKRRLRSLTAASRQEGGRQAAAVSLRPGTKLIREWRRQLHSVNVLDHGFEYQGERYASLSAIARHITGVSWSGPRFFGLGQPPRRAAGRRDER